MYSSNEFLHSAGVSRHMQATGETPSQKTSMKRRSCEVPLGDISSNNFKISLGDITNENNFDCRSIRSFKSEDTRSLRSYRPIDSRSVKNFRSSLADISAVSTCSLSRPPSYDQLSRRSFIEGPDAQGITSSIEGVLWSDEEENEYFYHENITSAWNQGTSNSGVSVWRSTFFKVPSDYQTAMNWLQAVHKCDHLSNVINQTEELFVCVRHFKYSDIIQCKQDGEDRLIALKLKPNAVPSENLSKLRSPKIIKVCSTVNTSNFRRPAKNVTLALSGIEYIDIPPGKNCNAIRNQNGLLDTNCVPCMPSANRTAIQSYIESSSTVHPNIIQAYLSTGSSHTSNTQLPAASPVITPLYILPPAQSSQMTFTPNIPVSSVSVPSSPELVAGKNINVPRETSNEEDYESDLVLSITSDQPVEELQCVITSLCNK